MDQATVTSVKSKSMMPNSLGTNGEAGSGLGLSLSIDTLEKIGGILSIESEKGKGSEFVIRIPTS